MALFELIGAYLMVGIAVAVLIGRNVQKAGNEATVGPLGVLALTWPAVPALLVIVAVVAIVGGIVKALVDAYAYEVKQ